MVNKLWLIAVVSWMICNVSWADYRIIHKNIVNNDSNVAVDEDLSLRVQRLENKLNAKVIYQLQDKLHTLQANLQQVQGKLEKTEHDLTKLQVDQQVCYKNLSANMVKLQARQQSAKVLEAKQQDLLKLKLTYLSNERDYYFRTYDFIKAKAYQSATQHLLSYIKLYPKGKYLPNAYYWLGELHLSKNQYNQALVDYKKVIKTWPNNFKTKEALLKIGLTYLAQQKIKLAEDTFHQVVKQYPNDNVAKLAQVRLKQIKHDWS